MNKQSFGRVGEVWAGRPAVGVGDFVFFSGQMAPEVLLGGSRDVVRSRSKEQTVQVFASLAGLAQEAGSSLDDLVKLGTFHTDLDDFAPQVEARRGAFVPPLPPSTAVECALPFPTADAQVHAVGVRRGTHVEVIDAQGVPKPRGPYSQGLVASPFIFLAGVLASDFVTGVAPEARVEPGVPYFAATIERQTRFVLDTIRSMLQQAGSSLDAVLKAQVFLTDMADHWGFERVWREYFAADPPARTVVEGGLVNPGCVVEVDVIALSPDADLRKQTVQSPAVASSGLAESSAVRAGDWLFFGSQLATDYETGVAPPARIDPNFPRYETAVKRQGNYVFEQLATLLAECGSSMDNIVHLWGFVPGDTRDFVGLHELITEWFGDDPPAVTAAGTHSLTVPECRLAIDGIALID